MHYCDGHSVELATVTFAVMLQLNNSNHPMSFSVPQVPLACGDSNNEGAFQQVAGGYFHH